MNHDSPRRFNPKSQAFMRRVLPLCRFTRCFDDVKMRDLSNQSKDLSFMSSWENNICLKSDIERKFSILEPAAAHISTDNRMSWWKNLDFTDQLARDTWPLPVTEDREGYHGSNHFSYWASGLVDSRMLLDASRSFSGNPPKVFLDLGCASGRVIRHTSLLQPDMRTLGCDINRLHVEWCNKFLPPSITAFQNHSIQAFH
ncbi:hypothetical protein ACFQU2_06780 [Siccirubricoccus deserti]